MLSNENDDLQSYLKQTKSHGSRSKDIDWSKLMESTELNNDSDVENTLLYEESDIKLFLKTPSDQNPSAVTSQGTPKQHSAAAKRRLSLSANPNLHAVSELVNSLSADESSDISSVTSYSTTSSSNTPSHSDEQMMVNIRYVSELSTLNNCSGADNISHTHTDYTPLSSDLSTTTATLMHKEMKQNVFTIDQLEVMNIEDKQNTEQPTLVLQPATPSTEQPTLVLQPATPSTEQQSTEHSDTIDDQYSYTEQFDSSVTEPTTRSTVSSTNEQEPVTRNTVSSTNKQEPVTRNTVNSTNKQEPVTRSTVNSTNKQEPVTRSTVNSTNKQEPVTRSTVSSTNKQEPVTRNTVSSTNEQDYTSTFNSEDPGK